MTSEIELVRAALRPAGPGVEGGYHERHVRPAALAEIERRGIDVAAVRRRMRALVAELEKLSDWDLTMVSLDCDAEGLWLLAADVYYGPLDWL
jgi:hypothetical protein